MAQNTLNEKGKRPLPSKVAAMKARKRAKLDGEEPISKKPKSHNAKSAKSVVRLEHLPWQTVSMPDRMDDYEGFFGLEEIEDVDVVKDVETGKVSFMSNKAKAEQTVEHNKENDENDVVDDGEEWSGFEDIDTADVSDKSAPLPASHQPNGKKGPQAYSGSFQTLIDQTDDDGEETDVSAWSDLRLSPDTLSALSKLGFTKPTAIQQKAIPEILAGHDVIGKASTGSGKTLAFGIPILEDFLETRKKSTAKGDNAPTALILSPTRELAHQLDKHLSALCNDGLEEGLTIATLTGGLSIQKQQRLVKNADIVIGTPGRLWEVMSDGHGVMAALKKINFLVIDEADRLLSQGHFKEVEEILNALDRQKEDEEGTKAKEPTPRQTLVFSATFDKNLQRKLATRASNTTSNDLASSKESMEYLLTRLNFRDEKPKFIDVDPISHMASGLKESLVECPAGTDKDLYLYTVLMLLANSKNGLRTLVFVNSVSAVKRLAPFLQNLNLPALALYSGMPQKARLRSIERFSAPQQSGSGAILVATDVAARGLDIPDVQVVLHYHLPRAADTYVHRSGRTARAGQSGSTILLCAPDEVAGVRRLVAKVHSSKKHNEQSTSSSYIRTLDINRKVVSRLKPRATLAKQLADVQVAKEKQTKEDDFMRAAAEDLGVDYDSETFADEGGKGRRGRGAGREKKAREAKSLSKAELASLRAELKGLLRERVNVGVSERYLTSGNVDIDALLRQQEDGVQNKGREFLGSIDGLGLEDL